MGVCQGNEWRFLTSDEGAEFSHAAQKETDVEKKAWKISKKTLKSMEEGEKKAHFMVSLQLDMGW